MADTAIRRVKISEERDTQTKKNMPAYVFATVAPHRLRDVVEDLKRNPSVDLLAPLVGRYDVVVRLKNETPEQVYRSVREIREVEGIKDTTFHIAYEGIENKPFEKDMKLGVSTIRVEHIPTEKMIKELSSVPGFIEGFAVPGQFDIVAFWQAKTDEDLVKTSVEKLPTLEGLSSSETFLTHSPFYKK